LNQFGLVPGEKRDPKEFEVDRVLRVQSMELWQSYHAQWAQIMIQFKRGIQSGPIAQYLQEKPLLVPPITPEINEYYLFHGTDKETVSKILEGGFDARFSNPLNMFGAGIYFAENSMCQRFSARSLCNDTCKCHSWKSLFVYKGQ